MSPAGSRHQLFCRVAPTVLLVAVIGAAESLIAATAKNLSSIELIPANPQIAVGNTQQFSATGKVSDGSLLDLTSTAKWTSSSAKVATIAPNGVATGLAPGQTTITATSGSKSATTILTVVKLDSIQITPNDPSVAVGKNLQLTAKGTYSSGEPKDISSSVTWKSLEPNVASISSSGLVTGVSQAQATIEAQLNKITGSTVVVVTAPVPLSISVNFANPASPPSKSQQLVAKGVFSDGSSRALSSTDGLIWKSLADSVATVSVEGLVTAVSAGHVTLQVSLGTVVGSIALTVSASNEIAVPIVRLAAISVTPQVVQPVGGKLPNSVKLAVFVTDCDKSGINLNGYYLDITGGGLSLSQTTVGRCVLTSTLSIDASAAPGTFSVILRDNNGNPIGSSDFAILDSKAGAIPNGLVPQVDVMYEVLTQSVCNDVFGKRVARNFYCIELKIGNNTGYPLQIAGIGFSRHIDALPSDPLITVANTSYASTRAVLLREEVLSPRNIFYHSIQAAGIIMASLNPFFRAPNPARNFATAASIVSGPLLAAIGIVGPDRVVGQLNNLDDQSFRDTQIIQNNQQIRTTIFIEKRALTEEIRGVSGQYVAGLYKEAAIKQKAANDLSAAISSAKTEANLTQPEKETVQAAEKAGQEAVQQANVMTQAAAQQAKSAATAVNQTVMNSEQEDVNPVFRFRTNAKGHSPLLVKLALGNVVIVGDEIAYLQRIQVQSNTPTPGSTDVTISPTTADVETGKTQQFKSTVTGNSNASVQWSVDGAQGGNTSLGTIDKTGNYTAPASVPTSNPVTVTATSEADTTKSASAKVAISAASLISPSSVNVETGKTQQFTAVIVGLPGSSVTWGVNNTKNGNSTVGTILDTGLYTAPKTVPSPSEVTVTATSTSDSTKSVSAKVTVTMASAVTITLSPSTPTVDVGKTQQFTATVTGASDTTVTWSVNKIKGGNSTIGKISNTGLYTSPGKVPTPNTVTVTATSVTDRTKFASTKVIIE
jgi:uncharacterized protein YjdB